MLAPGVTVLSNRYQLGRQIQSATGATVWVATDKNDNEFMVKCWEYAGLRPDDVHRALWDLELRNLLRLSSSPAAESHLVVLCDAGIDTEQRQFVMVLQAPGLFSLEWVLGKRSHYDWLRDLSRPEVRAGLWRGLKQVARGLGQLHEQQMLHRALNAASVMLDPESGPSSMRLGGFEWTMRVGGALVTSSPPQALHPPEWRARPLTVFSFESDWFLFGVLVARILAPIDPSRNDPHEEVVTRVRSEAGLIDVERDLILRLLDSNPTARLARAQDVLTRIDVVLSRLDQPILIGPDKHLALIVGLGERMALTQAIIEQDETIRTFETERQREFIQKDLRAPRVVRQPNGAYVLIGVRLAYAVREFYEGDPPGPGLWALAFCTRPAELRYAEGGGDQRELTQVPIRVFDRGALRRNAAAVQAAAVHWRQFLPQPDQEQKAQERLHGFHDFFRLTNQIELLFGDASIFAYELVSYRVESGAETAVIRQAERARPAPSFAISEPNLIRYISREKAEKDDGNLVFLGHDDALRLEVKPNTPIYWKVTNLNEEAHELTLHRVSGGQPAAPPDKGFLRTYGLSGQVSLIRRRKEAIEKLRTHAYLLRALLTPDFSHIHTGQADLPRPIEGRLDEAKQKAIQEIWETRPIFALQGPPGTGKTTLVANLLGQIFDDDPVAQVLVSAQAHAAVDVLREKVKKEIFHDAAEDSQPLSIRIPRSTGQKVDDDPDYPAPATRRMLERALQKLPADAIGLRGRWRAAVVDAVAAIKRREGGDLVELVTRSANLTYCTTTSASLARLAVSTQSFDWSIIEEAGKAHGFDLVLPLQNGHRWLLIGDQKQLYPYRDSDFFDAIGRVDEVVDALDALPQRGGGLVDVDLIRSWRDSLDAAEKSARRDLWLGWRRPFGRLYDTCLARQPGLCRMLSEQHRMHPVIAGLISRAYYADELNSATVDPAGAPLPRVLHPFTGPHGIAGQAIVWLDVPSTKKGGQAEDTSRGVYTSPTEADAVVRFIRSLRVPDACADQFKMAVLSPYRLQVFELSRAVSRLYGPDRPTWLKPHEEKHGASTVDSFQGNQAQIVVVSLVRNNDRPPGHGLGFLAEASRMNVLFSRAEQLLVLVGSWDFFQAQLDGFGPENPSLGHWRVALDYLAECFEKKTSVRISADQLEGLE